MSYDCQQRQNRINAPTAFHAAIPDDDVPLSVVRDMNMPAPNSSNLTNRNGISRPILEQAILGQVRISSFAGGKHNLHDFDEGASSVAGFAGLVLCETLDFVLFETAKR